MLADRIVDLIAFCEEETARVGDLSMALGGDSTAMRSAALSRTLPMRWHQHDTLNDTGGNGDCIIPHGARDRQQLLILVDNSNIFIEGQKCSARRKREFPRAVGDKQPADPS
jgi:hypothetical protein